MFPIVFELLDCADATRTETLAAYAVTDGDDRQRHEPRQQHAKDGGSCDH
jgi:hypothetical protein